MDFPLTVSPCKVMGNHTRQIKKKSEFDRTLLYQLSFENRKEHVADDNFGGCLHGGRKIIALGRPEKAERLFVCFTCRNFGRSGYQVEKEKKNNCRPLAAACSAAAMFVLFVPSTRIFRAKVVYMVQGSSYLPARKFLSLRRS